MGSKMTHAAIAELADAIRACYEEATPVEKHRILAEFIAAFGHNKNPRSAC